MMGIQVILCNSVNFTLRAQNNADSLMQAFGLNVQNGLLSVAGGATSLLDQPAHGVGLVHQSEFARFVRLSFVPGIHEDAPAHQNTVHIGHHGGDPAHIEVFAPHAFGSCQALIDVPFDRRIPMAHIAHVDGKLLRLRGNLYVFLCQEERTFFLVQGEHADTVAHSQDQGGLWSVDAVARGHLLASSLQEVLRGDITGGGGFFQHTEDGAYAHIDINIARSIQGVKQQQVLTLWITIGYHVDVIHFL